MALVLLMVVLVITSGHKLPLVQVMEVTVLQGLVPVLAVTVPHHHLLL